MKWIDRQSELDDALRAVGKHAAFAMDTEADSLHSYFDKVCLIQISVPGLDLLIDPLADLDLSALGKLLGDPAVMKILHGADYDLRILGRDFDFVTTNLVDTMICAQLAGYEAFGLAALLKRHFDVTLDKSHQRADWSRRPLPADMLRYAVFDTKYLQELAHRMREELERLGRWEWAQEEFSRMENVRWKESEDDPEPWRKMKGLGALSRRSLAVVARMHGWRDAAARRLDRPPFKVMGNETLLAIATTRPKTPTELGSIKGFSEYQMRKYGREIMALLHEAENLPESDLPQPGEKKQWNRDRELERRVERLKKARDEVAASLHIDPAILAPRHVLTAVAAAAPSTLEELSAIPAMREWQKRVVGDTLLGALRSEPPGRQ
jgi:ribonuclease D